MTSINGRIVAALLMAASAISDLCVASDPAPMTATEIAELCSAYADLADLGGKNPPDANTPAASAALNDPDVRAVGEFCTERSIDKLTKRPIPSVTALRAGSVKISAVQAGGPKGVLPGTVTGFTSLNESTVLWGLTDVLLKRAGQELDAWALDEFRVALCPSDRITRKTIQVGNFVPETCKVIAPEDFLIGRAGSLLLVQQALQKDLMELPKNTASEFVRTRYCADPKACDTSQNDPLHAFYVVALASQRAIDGHSILRAIVEIPQASCDPRLPCLGQLDRAFALTSAIYDASFLLGALYDPATDDLVYQDDASYRLAAVKAAIVNANARRKGWPDGSMLFSVAGDAASLWDQVVKAKDAIAAAKDASKTPPPGANVDVKQRKASELAAHARAVAECVAVERLALEVLAARDDKHDYRRAIAASEGVEAFMRALADRNLALAGFEVAGAVIELLPGDSAFALQSRRVLGLAGSVAQAKDSDGVAAAFDSFVAPAGSSKSKRIVKSNYFQVNAYLGGFVAGERVAQETKPSIAPWISVGFEAGLGNRRCGPFGAYGFYVQALDLGALGSYRLGSEKTATEPKVSVKDVFSPGAFLTFALRKAPISFGFGLSYSPELRKIKTATGEPERFDSALRVGLAVALDVPIFP